MDLFVSEATQRILLVKGLSFMFTPVVGLHVMATRLVSDLTSLHTTPICTRLSSVKSLKACLFKQKTTVKQNKKPGRISSLWVFFWVFAGLSPSRTGLSTREPREPWPNLEACYLTHSSPPAAQVRRIPLIGASANALTGAIWGKWAVHPSLHSPLGRQGRCAGAGLPQRSEINK